MVIGTQFKPNNSSNPKIKRIITGINKTSITYSKITSSGKKTPHTLSIVQFKQDMIIIYNESYTIF